MADTIKTHSSIATDSEAELRKAIGSDATATFEEDPTFGESNPTESASSQNVAVQRDEDDTEDSDEEEEADEDDDLEDEDEEEDEDDEDEFEDEDEPEADTDKVVDAALRMHPSQALSVEFASCA